MSQSQLHEYRLEQAASVKGPYIGLALVLFVLAGIVASYRLPTIATAEAHGSVHDSVWRHRHLVFGAVGIFVYVGAEVAIGSLLTNYINQPEIGNVSLKDAAGYLPYYWGGAMVGRFAGSAILQKISTHTVLGVNAIAACALVMISMLSFGHVAMWSLILVGLFNSIMFPSIFTLAIDGLGPLTSKASGVLVAAIVGGAIIPELQGVLSDHIGIHHAFMLPALCYVFIALYGFKLSRRVQAAH
jgi:FHS family L-fucose permease-like MFS transporter